MSGYGNVAWGIMKKAAELGAKVSPTCPAPTAMSTIPTASPPSEKLNFILEMRAKRSHALQALC